MKIIAAADLHMTAARPVNRTDNYEETVLGKFDQILSLARKHDAVLTISGDLFDTVKLTKIPYVLTNKILQMIRLSKVRVLACHGQHDMTYHNPNLQTSPYYTLLVGGGVEVPGAMGITIGDVRFYGAGWGQEIAMPGVKTPDLIDVLLLHRTITPGEPPFFLKDATSAKDALKTLHNFDFVLSGDYHSGFVHEEEVDQDVRFLVNPGPMLRSSIDSMSYQPRVYLIDTEVLSVEPTYLHIEENVWNTERIEKQSQHEISVNTQDLLAAMSRQEDRPDYFKILDRVLDAVENPELVELVKGVLLTAQKNLEGVKCL
jgi:DNA repair exonuclease SbcCD nuclease subunit